MENENPAWKPLDCRSNTASISVSSLEGDTESQSIEIIKPTASAVRRHCWMEDEDSTWDSQVSLCWGRIITASLFTRILLIL
ncbi:hypothetical protein XENTR_v10017612 [Xenopus tropicalis]|nr:hypothetical protein XENTR_v10017612 [Xenopus tropicalis]